MIFFFFCRVGAKAQRGDEAVAGRVWLVVANENESVVLGVPCGGRTILGQRRSKQYVAEDAMRKGSAARRVRASRLLQQWATFRTPFCPAFPPAAKETQDRPSFVPIVEPYVLISSKQTRQRSVLFVTLGDARFPFLRPPWSRGIAFCADVRHAHDLARVLNDHDITAMAVDGGMSKEVRRAAVLRRPSAA